jgi:dUTP pyrophosphatase
VPRQALRQQCPRPGEAPRDRALGPPEHGGGFPPGPAFEIAQDDHGAVDVGQTTQLFVEQNDDRTPPVLLARGEAANLTPGKYEGDAGIDLAINEEVQLMLGQYKLVGTGVHVAVPPGYFGLITARSSTWAKYRCRIVQGVIDSGYRGELKVGIEATTEIVHFERGMRLAQLILLPTFGGQLVHVDELPEHERGDNGYGSSGH